MSGFRLRALLEEVDFCSNLTGGSKEGKLADKNKFQTPSNVPNAASLLNNNIWADSDEDFNLEYMDLDEFLSETGLVDANFANIMNANPFSPAPAPQKAQTELSQSPINGLDNLLSSVDHTPSPSSSEQGVVSVTEATQQVLPAVTSPSPPSPSPESDAATKSPTKSKDVQSSEQPQINIVKKRKYKEDGEGLSDTAVVVVPGQEGFDPAQTKFAPEELQPQPIIKKSKKQFVPEENKDEKYWRRRNKNNVAAKRSREARRAKENQIIMRAGFLETENERLTRENEELIKENEELRDLVQKLKAQRK